MNIRKNIIKTFAAASAIAMSMSVCGAAVSASDEGIGKFPGVITYIDGNTYCMDENGEYITGWLKNSEGDTFYFRKSGEMAKNVSLLLDGRLFRFGEDGEVLYRDPKEGSSDTTFRPPLIGESAKSVHDRCGSVNWQQAAPRTDTYAYDAYTFINGSKCPVTYEFDASMELTAWYIDIPADYDEQVLILNLLFSFWGEPYAQDENNVYYWYYYDYAEDCDRGVAADFQDGVVSISAIDFGKYAQTGADE